MTNHTEHERPRDNTILDLPPGFAPEEGFLEESSFREVPNTHCSAVREGQWDLRAGFLGIAINARLTSRR